ncbi:MAG: HD domain-containing protein [Bacilli bacterium]|nr:HD domain-containing protein [Bacilli bacterium]
MKKWETNKEYINLVNDILSNDEFKKLKEFKHHGDNRLNHVIRVSYYSYLISKRFNMNTRSVARAGLLHDFFLVNNQEISLKERIKVLITHPKLAVENSKKHFKLNKLEENIIISHMFPFYKALPKYKESWLVNTVDNAMAFYERYFTIKDKVKSMLENNPIYERLKVNN